MLSLETVGHLLFLFSTLNTGLDIDHAFVQARASVYMFDDCTSVKSQRTTCEYKRDCTLVYACDLLEVIGNSS